MKQTGKIILVFTITSAVSYFVMNAYIDHKLKAPDKVSDPTGTIYPDKTLTPGAVLTVTMQDLCKVGYTKTIRNVPLSERKLVFQRYNIPYNTAGQYEVDHLISLELGGSNDVTNLWPEKYCPVGVHPPTCIGARDKDVVETELHREICSGKMTLLQAQTIISTDWYSYYKKIKALSD